MNGQTHTPGPWGWFGTATDGVYLATQYGGRKYVMGFKRKGMRGAEPMFKSENRMVPASELASFQVGDPDIRGEKSAKMSPSVYRYDVSEIDNPDARLIATAPELLEALEVLTHGLPELLANNGLTDEDGLIDAALAVIVKATGKEGDHAQ